MRCRWWFAVGLATAPALALTAHEVTIVVARYWWAHHHWAAP